MSASDWVTFMYLYLSRIYKQYTRTVNGYRKILFLMYELKYGPVFNTVFNLAIVIYFFKCSIKNDRLYPYFILNKWTACLNII